MDVDHVESGHDIYIQIGIPLKYLAGWKNKSVSPNSSITLHYIDIR